MTPSLPSYPTLLPMLLLAALAVAAIAEQDGQRPMTLAGCPDKCGGISVPFPFGTKPGCFLPGFEVTCDTSFSPPRAFLAYNASMHKTGEMMGANGTISNVSAAPVELMDISAAMSEARAYGAVRSQCFTGNNINSSRTKLQSTLLDRKGPFVLSWTRNVLAGVGYIVDAAMGSSPIEYASRDNGYKAVSCSGVGSCQASLARTTFNFWFGVLLNAPGPSRRWDTNPCSYGMVVESSWYDFSMADQDGLGYERLPDKFPRGVPFVIDFVIRNKSCPTEGQQPPPGYACVSGNSSCANSTAFVPSHICKCWDHYDGNPYIVNGCQDIDECEVRKQSPELRDLYPCSSDGICKNRLEGYDCPCKPGMKGDGKAGTCTEKFPLAAKVTVGLAALIVVFVLMFMVHQYLKLKRFYEQNGGPLLKGIKNIRIYSRKELKHITSNYKSVIGKGAFGEVYMGTLKDKQKVAVKKSLKVDKDRKNEFTEEIIIQSGMRQKNIVMLLGCCLQMDVPMLVYEFVANGSLYDVLFKGRDGIPVDTRLGIAVGSAEGLTYMHNSAGKSTIRHGDVKSANILLDENFTPKVADFGTSKLLARGKDEKTDFVIGDESYIDPVYMEKGMVTQKSDVYSFGIVLIELITRRPATYDKNRSYVANFVQAFLDKRARNFIDSAITIEADIKLLEMVGGVAVECLKPNPEERLDMKQVEHRLVQIVGQSAQHVHGQEINYQGSISPSPADVALLMTTS